MRIALRLFTLWILWIPVLLATPLAFGQGQVNLVSARFGPGPYVLEIWYALGQTQDESLLRPLPGAVFNYTNSVLTPGGPRVLNVPGSIGGEPATFQARIWKPDPRATTYLEAEAADPLCESIPRWVNCLQTKTLGGKDLAGNVVLPLSLQFPGNCHEPLRGCVADRPTNLDPSFSKMRSGFDGDVNGVELLESGKMWVAGAFGHWNGQPISRLALLTSEGEVEKAPWLVTPPNGDIYGTAQATNGSILLAGAFTELSGRPFKGVAQLLPHGAADPNFKTQVTFGPLSNGSTIAHPLCLAVQGDGKIWVGGGFGEVDGKVQGGFVRLLPDGTLDPEFQLGSGVNDTVFCIHPLGQGAALIGGRFSAVSNPGAPAWNQYGIVKVKANGEIDPTWNHNLGKFSTVYSIAPFATDLVVLGGLSMDGKGVNASRISFAQLQTGEARRVQLGTLTWNWNGEPEPAQFPAYVSALKTTRDGRIVVGGRFRSAEGYYRSGLTRYASVFTGTLAGFPYQIDLDLALNAGLGFGEETENHNGLSLIRGIKEQPDGKLLLFGAFTRFEDRPAGRLVRLFADAERAEELTTITEGAQRHNPADDQIVWKSAPGGASWLEATSNFVDWTVVAPRETNVFRVYTLWNDPADKQRFYRVRR